MLRDIEALLHGQPTDLAIHPRLPDCDPHRVVQFEFRWELESSPRQLWPLVTNTDRLDRAIGFAPVKYKTRYEPGRGVRTFAEGRKAGMVEVGEEHPYEWIEPRRMGVLREYSQGPFRWMVSVVELTPRPGGGTTLIHRLQLEPSSWKIRVGSRWGVGVGLRKSLERVYRRIDATVKSQSQRGLSAGSRSFRRAGRDAGPAAPAAGTAARPIGRTGHRRGGRRPAGRAPGPRCGPGGGPDPPAGPGRALGTRPRPGRRAPACTVRAKGCSSCTGTCSARSAASHARSPTRSARSPSMPTARLAISTSSSTSPTRSS